MDHFLIYIIVSSLATLVSIMFAYKPEDDELRLVDYNQNDIEGMSIESTPVYTDLPMKTEAGNKLQASMY